MGTRLFADVLREMEKDMEADWLQIHEDGEPYRLRFERILIAYGLADFLWLVWATDHGHVWQSPVGILAASQLPILLVVWLWEYQAKPWLNPRRQLAALGRTLRKYSPRTQSWAFMADAFAFAPMAAFATLVLGSIHGKWFDTGWIGWLWLFASLAGGAAFSWSFRRGEGDAYDVLRYFSFSKLLHNGVAFTVLGGYIIHSIVPVVIYGWHWGRVVSDIRTIFKQIEGVIHIPELNGELLNSSTTIL